MKYLVSAITLGKLVEANRERREEIVDNLISLHYINGTSDRDSLTDAISLNKKVYKTNKLN